MSEGLKKFTEDMKKSPGKAILMIIVLLGALIAVGKNVLPQVAGGGGGSSGGGGASTVASMSQKVQKIEDLKMQLAAKSVEFARLQRRAGSFMIIDPNSETVGIMVQDAVRAIAADAGITLNVGTYRVSAISDSMQSCEVPFSGSAGWPRLLEFLSQVELALPNFVWSNFSLSTRDRDPNIHFTCALKIVLVKDPQFQRVLEPIHEQIRKSYSGGTKKAADDSGMRDFGSKIGTVTPPSIVDTAIATDTARVPGIRVDTARAVRVDDDFEDLDDDDFDWEDDDDDVDSAPQRPATTPAAGGTTTPASATGDTQRVNPIPANPGTPSITPASNSNGASPVRGPSGIRTRPSSLQRPPAGNRPSLNEDTSSMISVEAQHGGIS